MMRLSSFVVTCRKIGFFAVDDNCTIRLHIKNFIKIKSKRVILSEAEVSGSEERAETNERKREA